jgi:hypothetical protein
MPDSPSDETEALRKEVKRLRKSLSDLTPSLDVFLRRRGFKIYRKEPSEDLLLPADISIEAFYEMMKKYSFRLFLRDVIKHQRSFEIGKVTWYATSEVTKGYVDYLSDVGLVEKASDGFRLAIGPIKSFGETLEWFVAEIFKKEFATEAIWGIRFKRPNVGGDYDLIAKVNGGVLYMEIKSSPPKQICQNEIAAFFDRVADLSPEISIFFVDTELRMKDKIVVMFEEELKQRYAGPPKVVRLEKELFRIGEKIFIINAKDSITANIEKVLARYFRRRR